MTRLAAVVVVAALGTACSTPNEPAGALELSPPSAAFEADPSEGRALLARFECNRCHEGTGLEEVAEERHCVRCHQSIRAGTFDAPSTHLRRWSRALTSLNHAPSLAHLDGRLRADWIASFLLNPHDVRPGLPATMPRLAITEEAAAHIAAALTEGAAVPEDDVVVAEDVAIGEPGDLDAGLALLDARGCYGCHAFGGVREREPPAGDTAALQLAPDLRHTRDRMSRSMLLRWLRAPSEVRPETPMPTPELAEEERALVVDAILLAELAPPAVHDVPERLPVLTRPVRFEEVADRVLSRTCWHCHADPNFAQGDGGAGNTGGFGFAARGVNLLDYAGVSSGYLDEEGERRSLFAVDDDGTPHLVRVLMARHHEASGEPLPGLTGMPLGLPPLSLEDIQLVESWIAQGRPN